MAAIPGSSRNVGAWAIARSKPAETWKPPSAREVAGASASAHGSVAPRA